MSSVAHSAEHPSRSWWSMSSKNQTQRYSTEKQKQKSPLNTIASALGLKAKKSPTLTIEDPPLPIQPPPQPSVAPLPKFTNRPPSKSVSSTLSRADSAEPRTPSDINYNPSRQSLLTLSDTDPFAGRGIVTIASPTDPTRLSAYSNGSGNDIFHTKQVDFPHNRTSYASSSSQSQGHGTANDSLHLKRTLSPISPSDSLPTTRIHKKASESNISSAIGRTNSYTAVERATRPPPPLHKSGSSNTLVAPSEKGKRPAMRPRGLTDNVTTQKSGFFVETTASKPAPSPRTPTTKPPPSASKPISPRVVIRQASLQHLNPPTAPPSQKLPATPHSPVDDDSYLVPGVSTGSSTISFASSTSSRDLYPNNPAIPHERPRRISDRSFFLTGGPEASQSERSSAVQPPLSPPAPLKKAVSHQNLRKKGNSFSTGSQAPSAFPADTENQRTPQKPRAFPLPRIPMPPMPGSIRHSSSSQSAPGEPNPSNSEPKRTSSSSGGRKRLFSGSSLRRPSTSYSTYGDDDSQSVFSMKSDQDMYISNAFFKPWITTQSTNSFWDEATPDALPNSPMRVLGNEFGSQQASPASTLGKSDLNPASSRQRGTSVRSAETLASEMAESASDHVRRFQRSNTITLSPRNNRLDAGQKTSAPSRPSTAQPTTSTNASTTASDAVPDPIEQSYQPSVSPPPMINSLPPPPRRQRTPVVLPPSEPEPPAKSLPPPPPMRLPQPPRIKSVTSIEKALHRRSIMKKPSFLEIDDDSSEEEEDDQVVPPVPILNRTVVGSAVGDSFLDFARESFDTVRST
ncbi:hypothetical protein CC1G_01811 [Coprinopsis cinerea okayama7|uniref:Uncharacterized protein n=1 Tax=Coprinopsis cinerea (strain Okayama-7 / 130 / ATCC MYA-4618 / FGSC 9003) TaxID=240176 RepID=A8N2F8_COPC7|nr:hypothetical protein CC1G_01811 [Coprinopsis cinerea okayama7\|eukprot:XP_001829131.2 hypothetical protein CC1G_01811 [Coprinopsis cinerea okayama7\